MSTYPPSISWRSLSILQLLKKINQQLNITILLITHEMEVIKNICDRVAILDNGLLVEQGSVIDVFTEPKLEITKNLTQKALHIELPNYLQAQLQPKYAPGLNTLVRLAFIGSSANEPIVITLLQRFKVKVNILQADLETIQDSTLGFMVCKLTGEPTTIIQAVQYLQTLNIKVEVMGYA